jgi:hypothetical protein
MERHGCAHGTLLSSGSTPRRHETLGMRSRPHQHIWNGSVAVMMQPRVVSSISGEAPPNLVGSLEQDYLGASLRRPTMLCAHWYDAALASR